MNVLDDAQRVLDHGSKTDGGVRRTRNEFLTDPPFFAELVYQGV
jgi:hypothetical protein